VVEGILVRGANDFVILDDCFESEQLDDSEAGEEASKSITFDQFINGAEGAVDGEGQGSGGPSTLFFSEYVERSSNNKALEIYNPTDVAVSLDGWSVSVFPNGATEPGNTLDLSTVAASLAPGDTLVVANSQADASVLAVADTTSTVTFYNGNDAVALFNVDIVVDVIGVIGEAVIWTDGGLATNEQTLRRKPSICGGNDTGFTPLSVLSAEWESFPQDTFSGLGNHSVTCSVVSEGEGAAEGEGGVEGSGEGDEEGFVDGEGEGEGEGQVSGEATLIISEYVEGSSNNKALEVFNPTGSAVNLSGWTLAVYSNGNVEPSNTLDLSTVAASLASGDTLVVANSQADASVLAIADTTSTVTFLNGDDAVVLAEGGTPVDVVGVVGEDPGTNWTDGGLATNEQTLRRKAGICSGNAAGFNPVTRLSAEWNTFAQNTFAGLGSHTVDCGGLTEGEGEGSEEGSEDGEGEGEGAPDGESSLCDTPGALYCEDFEDNEDDTTNNANDDLQALTAVSVSSTGNNADWHIFAAAGNKFARINGFGADEQSDDWLISPAFDFNASTGEVLSFDTAYNFDGPALEFLYSTNYSGQPDPSDADWTPIAFSLPGTGNFAFASSGLLDVSGINGAAVYFAWRYTSTGTGPGQSRVWEVDNILLTADLPVGEGEGTADGEGATDGEGSVDGEGEAVCGPEDLGTPHDADRDGDFLFTLSELLRLVQVFNVGGLSCAEGESEDGFLAGPGATDCTRHNADYSDPAWVFDLGELLRGIQLYNAGGYYECPGEDTDDGYCTALCL